MSAKPRRLFEPELTRRAAIDAVRKLHPRHQLRNPVMFVVWVVSFLTSGLFVHAIVTGSGEEPAGFILGVSLWLWFTVIFANFAEAMAEGRGKAQAAALRKNREEVAAKRLLEPRRGARWEPMPGSVLRK